MTLEEKAEKLNNFLFGDYSINHQPGFVAKGKDRLFVYIFDNDFLRGLRTQELPDLGVAIEIKRIGRPKAL